MTEYEKIFKRLKGDISPFERMKESLDPAAFIEYATARDRLIPQYSFAIPSSSALRQIKRFAPFLEVGAGNGYWAYEMQRMGIPIFPTDPHPAKRFTMELQLIGDSWTKIHKVGALTAVKTANKVLGEYSLLMVWPTLGDSWSAKALAAFKGSTLIYVGEGNGGCTACSEFFKILDKKWVLHRVVAIPHWYGIKDYLYIFQRH
jgi:hypothetical protein